MVSVQIIPRPIVTGESIVAWDESFIPVSSPIGQVPQNITKNDFHGEIHAYFWRSDDHRSNWESPLHALRITSSVGNPKLHLPNMESLYHVTR